MVILPSAYMGSVSYFAHLLLEDCVIDTGEHFLKCSPVSITQSSRSRCAK